MSVRLPAALADDLDQVARVDGVPVAEALRTAVAGYVAARHADPVWQGRLVAAAQAAAQAVRRLVGEEAGG
jgi:predicted transcriptional regulator